MSTNLNAVSNRMQILLYSTCTNSLRLKLSWKARHSLFTVSTRKTKPTLQVSLTATNLPGRLYLHNMSKLKEWIEGKKRANTRQSKPDAMTKIWAEIRQLDRFHDGNHGRYLQLLKERTNGYKKARKVWSALFDKLVNATNSYQYSHQYSY